MAVDIDRISINTDPNGFDSWLDYADMLQELADELDAFRNVHRNRLEKSQRNNIRFGANRLRQEARTIATLSAIKVLEDAKHELEKLRAATGKMDELIQDINNAKDIISGIGEIFNVISNILTLVV
jgi:hypothetical protein